MSNGERRISDLKEDLKWVINELESIASILETDFEGIGTERCAQIVRAIKEDNKTALSYVNKVKNSEIMK